MPILHLPYTYVAQAQAKRSRTSRTTFVVDTIPFDVPDIAIGDLDGRLVIDSLDHATIHFSEGRAFTPVFGSHLEGDPAAILAGVLDRITFFAQDEGPIDLIHPAKPRLATAAVPVEKIGAIFESDRDQRRSAAFEQAKGLAVIDGVLHTCQRIPLIDLSMNPDGTCYGGGANFIRRTQPGFSLRIFPSLLPSTVDRFRREGLVARNLDLTFSGSARDHDYAYDDRGGFLKRKLQNLVMGLLREQTESTQELHTYLPTSDSMVLTRCLQASLDPTVSFDQCRMLFEELEEVLEGDVVQARHDKYMRSFGTSALQAAREGIDLFARFPEQVAMDEADVDAITAKGFST